jgi:hypothetical protein
MLQGTPLLLRHPALDKNSFAEVSDGGSKNSSKIISAGVIGRVHPNDPAGASADEKRRKFYIAAFCDWAQLWSLEE